MEAQISAAQTPTATSVITEVKKIRQLPPEKASRRYPVRVTGIITARTEAGFFFQQDGAGIFVHATAAVTKAAAGELIEVTGVTDSGAYAPAIAASGIATLGRRGWPIPRRTSFEQLSSGEADAQWVEVSGIVHSIDPGANQGRDTELTINEDGHDYRALVSGLSAAAAERLIDAEVRIQGVCSSLVNQRGQFIGFRLLTPTAGQIVIESPSPADLSSLPVTPIDSLLRFTAAGTPRRRVRVQGIVTLHRPGAHLFIQDGNLGLFIHTTTRDALRPGDKVDVAGFVAPGDYTPMLLHASVRKIASEQPPAPRTITGLEARSGKHDAELVELEGTVLDVRHSAAEEVLVIRSAGVVFDAYLRREAGNGAILSTQAGSFVRITGVCSVKVDQNRTPRTFRVVLRSQNDVAVIKRPPWPLDQIMIALAALALAALTACAWVFLLRKRVREQTLALKRQFTEIETLYRTAPVGLCFVDSELRYVRINEQLAATNGVPAADHIGRPLREIVPTLAPILEPLYRQVLETGEPIINTEIRGEATAGNAERIWLTSYYPVKGKKVFGVSAVIQDITDLKYTEARLVKQANDLALSNAELQQFAYVASHDLQEPLRTITAFSQMLATRCKGELSGDSGQYLTFIVDASNRMQALVRDLLIYARLTDGDDSSTRRAPITVAVEWALKNLEATIREAGAAVEYENLPPVLVDQTQLLQVFQNLIANAIAYRNAETPKIRISAQQDYGEWIFSVADNGIGIDPRYHERIFGVFKRLDRDKPGTGVGLAICKKIIEQHGGRIWVESAAGQGSTFRFSLPATAASLAAS